ncbi:MAG: bifunctional diaminohydroxyphosphoribosylaminopyrimidine deaminase/5-amino-6-(5-phosphoribosylamino)uracil reductase RibD [Gammaproteobacteria bacterium]|nr:bifunctional diaminohydroxyphosphoribosylaminopyrimidine deaminase/5-amino-6-(5-phosphoribosylamino)uracil reductase RibD [Gammaproteobacteria bacterium]
MFKDQDISYMLRAINLAKKAWYLTDPNPRVGCVIAKNNQIIGEGFHIKAGGPHAEIHAIRAAQENGYSVKGATAYVSLEPCSHHGKTPPCCDALIENGISRVVVAMTDPNPLVSGKGIERLKKAGVEVDVGLLEKDARDLNPEFLYKMKYSKPYIRCKMGMSLDGRTAMASGESQWITSSDSRLDVQRIRAESSAILTGIGTVLADNPSMNVRENIYTASADNEIRQPEKLIMDSQLRIPIDAKILALPELVTVFTSSKQLFNDKSIKLRDMGVRIISLNEADYGLDLNQLMDELSSMSHNSVLLESGKSLAGSLLSEKLVNEIVLYIAPTLLGNEARGLFDLPQLQFLKDAPKLSIKDLRQIGPDIRIIATLL